MRRTARRKVFEEVPEDSLDTWDVRRGKAGEVGDFLWVLVKKYNEMRQLLKYKARATVRGDQLKAIDIKLNRTPSETYAPTVRQVTCKMATAAPRSSTSQCPFLPCWMATLRSCSASISG